MAYFELLARDYSEWLTHAKGGELLMQADVAGADVLDAATCGVLVMALLDIEQAGLFSAVSASLTAVMLDPSAPEIPVAHLATYAPPEDESYPSVKRRLIETGAPAPVVVALETHHARLQFALRLTQALVAGSELPAERRRDEIEKLHDAWCRACGAALKSSDVLRQVLLRADHPADGEPFNGRAAVVAQAAEGFSPCVDRGGCITVPGWAEKRITARFPVNTDAKAIIDGEAIDVFIKDASATGLGLTGVPHQVLRGSEVSITLLSGEVLKGTIAWCRSGTAGMALEDQLPPDHVLLKHGRS